MAMGAIVGFVEQRLGSLACGQTTPGASSAVPKSMPNSAGKFSLVAGLGQRGNRRATGALASSRRRRRFRGFKAGRML